MGSNEPMEDRAVGRGPAIPPACAKPEASSSGPAASDELVDVGVGGGVGDDKSVLLLRTALLPLDYTATGKIKKGVETLKSTKQKHGSNIKICRYVCMYVLEPHSKAATDWENMLRKVNKIR
jgi:hypothetical protein